MSAKCRIPVNKTSGEMGIKGEHRGGESNQNTCFLRTQPALPEMAMLLLEKRRYWGHWKIRPWFCIWP